MTAPTNLRGAFFDAFAPQPLKSTSSFWGPTTFYVDCETTNFDTWDNLITQGKVTPLMLHVASNYVGDNLSLKRAVSSGMVSDGYVYAAVGTKYYVTILAKA